VLVAFKPKAARELAQPREGLYVSTVKALKLITLRGANAVAVAVAEFNGGYSHIIEDDGCWVVVNGGADEARPTPHIFSRAMAELRGLPDNPGHYRPLLEVLTSDEEMERLRRERFVRQVMES
jgi:hypothetical protein